MTSPVTILCLASFFKGEEFLRECQRQNCRVLLLTKEKNAAEAWPRDAIAEIFYMPELSNRQHLIHAISYLMRTQPIHQIVPLDDFDVQMAASLREHFRLPGIGETVAHHYRDKLAMRTQASQHGLRVPDFCPLFNHAEVHDFTQRVPAPWMLKPRAEAGAMGIKKIHTAEQLWQTIEALGDTQSFFLLERFTPGDVYHVDCIVSEGEVVFASAQKYGHPPFDVSHGGGVFVTRVLDAQSEEAVQLRDFNAQLMTALGMVRGVSHTEFIRNHEDGQFYFLETAARVAGARIPEMIEAASGVNMWAEWARIEITFAQGTPYTLPAQISTLSAGLLVCLARQEHPDYSSFNAPEVVWHMGKKYHAGVIVASPDAERVYTLLQEYEQLFNQNFLAVMPAWESVAEADH